MLAGKEEWVYVAPKLEVGWFLNCRKSPGSQLASPAGHPAAPGETQQPEHLGRRGAWGGVSTLRGSAPLRLGFALCQHLDIVSPGQAGSSCPVGPAPGASLGEGEGFV